MRGNLGLNVQIRYQDHDIKIFMSQKKNAITHRNVMGFTLYVENSTHFNYAGAMG